MRTQISLKLWTEDGTKRTSIYFQRVYGRNLILKETTRRGQEGMRKEMHFSSHERVYNAIRGPLESRLEILEILRAARESSKRRKT